MASMIEMLLETMPFAAAARGIKEKFGKTFDQCEADQARQFIRLLARDASFDVDLPAVNPDLKTEEQQLWAYSHSGSEPAAVRSVYCRVHDADYVGHLVAEKIQWGLEEPVDCFQSAVRMTFNSGGQVILPLTPEYVFSKWQILGGMIDEDMTSLWRLRSLIDSSLVVVFAYELDPATGELRKLDIDRVQDPKLRDELKKADEAARQLFGVGAQDTGDVPPEPPPATGAPDATPWNEVWGSTMLKGDLWPTGGERGPTAAGAPAGITGQVGQTYLTLTEPARLMVVFSFTTCRQRADFEPGGVVGFARCYPHLLVSATVPIKKVEGSVQINRPRHLAKWEEPDRAMGASCCKPPYDGWSDEIRSMLVADANSRAWLTSIPFWSNLFAYYMVDPYRALGSTKFHVVRTDRTFVRSEELAIVREVAAGFDKSGLVKEAYQGEFDNIHMAPRLKLMNVAEVVIPGPADIRRSVRDRRKWRLDEIAMAPFCAHDCLHLHWRWSPEDDNKWNLGWGEMPYSVAGAPMVPKGQDVWVWFRSDHRSTYHVTAPPASTASDWTVLMHHGFGYAVAIEKALKAGLAMFAIDTFSGYFFDDGSHPVGAEQSTAAYYYAARYDVEITEDGDAHPVERLHWDSDETLRKAREL